MSLVFAGTYRVRVGADQELRVFRPGDEVKGSNITKEELSYLQEANLVVDEEELTAEGLRASGPTHTYPRYQPKRVIMQAVGPLSREEQEAQAEKTTGRGKSSGKSSGGSGSDEDEEE